MNGTQSQEAVAEVNTFIRDLIDKRIQEGQTLAVEERENLQKLLLDQLGIFILESIYQEMSEEQQLELKKMIGEKKSLDELRGYAASHIDNYDEFVMDVMLDFEDAYLAGDLDQDATSAYINSLIERKNFSNLTPEQREDIFQDIAKRLDEYIMARSLAQFTEEEITGFKQLLAEKKTKAELQQFTMDHITDYPKFLDDTLGKFEEAYLA